MSISMGIFLTKLYEYIFENYSILVLFLNKFMHNSSGLQVKRSCTQNKTECGNFFPDYELRLPSLQNGRGLDVVCRVHRSEDLTANAGARTAHALSDGNLPRGT